MLRKCAAFLILGFFLSLACIQTPVFATDEFATQYKDAKVVETPGTQTCQDRLPVSDAGNLPKDFKKQAIDSIKKKLYDPYSMKVVSWDGNQISYGNTLKKELYGIDCRHCYWTVFFVINAKNRMGGYSGARLELAYFRQGKLFYSGITSYQP